MAGMRCAFPQLPGLLLTFALCACAPGDDTESPDTLTVFAAASTTEVITEAAQRFEAESGTRTVCSFGPSSSLARQILAGAPADVYLSANQAWMDELESAGTIHPGSRHVLLANELVLIAPRSSALEIDVTRETSLADVPRLMRFALGDPAHVPAGRYAKQALESLRWWTHLEPTVIPAADVRAALRLVEIGEADAGIVYATDTRRSRRIDIISTVPPDLHEPITYPIARCTNAPAGVAFIEFLRSPDMRTVFEDAGFRVVEPEAGKEH